ncbi:MAG: molybdopterin molybdenumtransferase MoeA, partial [Bacteroidetes bacterium]|nr:molybdopterin molybdenumtransferase MoeA [Bacteroidota bacterium]
MITVKEAQRLVINNTFFLQTEEVALHNASGRILAQDIQAPISHPMFDNSAVDGYAFWYNGLPNKKIRF